MRKWTLFFIFMPVFLFSLTGEDIQKKKFNQKELTDMIEDLVIQGNLDQMTVWTRSFPASFSGLDFGMAYYEVGEKFYERKLVNLAYKCYLKGFSVYGDSPYKVKSAYRLAKILLNKGEKDSALYYINRGLERNRGDEKMEKMLKQLKTRVRWDYISHYEGLPDDSVADIEFDGDDVWIGMWTGGIARFTRSSETLTLFKPQKGKLISQHVRDLVITPQQVWVGTYEGLCYYEKKTGEWTRVKNKLGYSPIKKMELIDGKLYIATMGNGLHSYDFHSGTWFQVFEESKYVTAVKKIGGKLYVGTLDKGVYRSGDGKTFEQILPGSAVKAIAELDSQLWVGTYGEGLVVYDLKTDKITRNLTQRKKGLTSNYVEALYPVAGKMIIGTLGGGFCVYQPAEDKIHSYGLSDGLPSPDVVQIAVEKRWVWFGTLSGGIGILMTENFEDL